MDHNQWEPKRRLELQLQSSLDTIGQSIQESIEGLTNPFEITTVIRSWLKNMAFHRYAEEAAVKMVSGLLNSSGKTWRMAARENTNGRIIYEALRKELLGPVGGSVAFQIQRNAEVIKSLPLDIARQVTDYVSDESIKGRRAGDISDDLLWKFPSMTHNTAKLIARTETSKTSSALTRARCENIGLNWYRWRTSEDARVRDSHKIMDKVLVKWTDPPSPEKLEGKKNPPAPYHAGNIWNCRCYSEPVVNLDYMQWPVKVYRNGALTTMSRAQFSEIM